VSFKGYTDIGGNGNKFATTKWTAIGKIRSNEAGRRDLIGDLLKKYWKPVYCYLRRKGYDNEEAKDLTQGFFHEVVLGRELVQQADKAKGRFRTFMLLSLERYLKSVHRKKTAQKRIPENKIVQLEFTDPADLPDPVDGLSSGDCFNYAWISALLDRILEEVESECRKDGMAVHWELFHTRIVEPIINHTPPASLAEICKKHGVKDQTKASNMIVTVKRRFQAALKRHLLESVSSDTEINSELREIMQFFSKYSAR